MPSLRIPKLRKHPSQVPVGIHSSADLVGECHLTSYSRTRYLSLGALQPHNLRVGAKNNRGLVQSSCVLEGRYPVYRVASEILGEIDNPVGVSSNEPQALAWYRDLLRETSTSCASLGCIDPRPCPIACAQEGRCMQRLIPGAAACIADTLRGRFWARWPSARAA